MTVHVEIVGEDEAITVVTLDRPERRNALDHATLAELTDVLAAAQERPTRVLVLTGASGHFCAGADLQGVEDASFASLLQGVLDRLVEVSFPTMAAIEGAALGAGTQLAVACDLRVATAGASFGIPAAKLGLMVNHWTVQRVATLLGPSTARAVLLAAEVVDGERALRLGLVNRQGALSEAMAWAEQIATLAPLTIAGHKLMLNKLEAAPAADDDVAAAFTRAWDSEDFAEGLDAFRTRRTPTFRGQ
ncbi:enoyl-CoA hydratase-related protein [Aquihabitans daechungensis]|uniref:enoyl-CoA hydratase-related protein n=1 Tax=Aquihabitans daechungensis TaxID=1052257 RepID=UPI003B9F412C